MKAPIRELPRTELPRALVYMTGVVSGVLAAMVVLIMLKHMGIELASMWRNVLSAQAMQMRAAGAWWLMVGSAFLVSAVTVAALSRLPWPWHRFRFLRWCIGAAIVFALAEAGHMAAAADDSGGTHVAITFVALCSAGLVSLFAAYFAMKR